ncbi:MAG: Gfo/Idh/MocA family oxidoreductase [Cellvibrionaceae bacterium]|nr:Gfo/Idh/MocA family oxidoreductase [Cellvibrionaceae bacterium]
MTLRLAVIGCGKKATQYIDTWISRPELALQAVMDPNAEAMANVRAIAKRQGEQDQEQPGQALPECFDSWEELLQSQHAALDAVYICTPHANHAEQAEMALQLGLDVLLEKPMVTSVAEAQRLIAAQQASGKTLVVAYQGGLSPLVQQLKRDIAAKTYGELVSVTASIWENWATTYKGHWKQIPAISGGGFMFDTGAHMMNTVSMLMSSPLGTVSANMQNLEYPVDIVTVVSGELLDGTLFNLHACGNSIRCSSRIECYFTEYVVRICAWGRWIEIEDSQGNVQRKEQESANNLMNVFQQTIRGDIANPSDIQQGLAMAKLWDGIKLSAAQDGKVVNIDPT